jgi:drug/metabolite transporter (DMT)-like permease
MTGLRQTDTATASLLLTLEGATTALIAWFIFHENFDRRTALGCFVSRAMLRFSPGQERRRSA